MITTVPLGPSAQREVLPAYPPNQMSKLGDLPPMRKFDADELTFANFDDISQAIGRATKFELAWDKNAPN
jgi:hypothetical protein